jgi:hypothetical protein
VTVSMAPSNAQGVNHRSSYGLSQLRGRQAQLEPKPIKSAVRNADGTSSQPFGRGSSAFGLARIHGPSIAGVFPVVGQSNESDESGTVRASGPLALPSTKVPMTVVPSLS